MGSLGEPAPLDFTQRISLKRDRFFKVQISEVDKRAIIDKRLVPRDIEGCITQVKIKDRWLSVNKQGTTQIKQTGTQNEIQRSVMFDVEEGKVLATLHYRVRDPSKRAKGSHQLSKVENHVVRFWFKITLKHVQDCPNTGKPKRKYVPRNTPLSVVFTLLGDKRSHKMTQKPIRINFFIETCSESAKRAKETTHELNLSISVRPTNKRQNDLCGMTDSKLPCAKKRKYETRTYTARRTDISPSIPRGLGVMQSCSKAGVIKLALVDLDKSINKLTNFLNRHSQQPLRFTTHIMNIYECEEEFYKYKSELFQASAESSIYSIVNKPLLVAEEEDACSYGFWKKDYHNKISTCSRYAAGSVKYFLGIYDLTAHAQSQDDLYVLIQKLSTLPDAIACGATLAYELLGMHFVYSAARPDELLFGFPDDSGSIKYGMRVMFSTRSQNAISVALEVAFQQTSKNIEGEIFQLWERNNQMRQTYTRGQYNPYRTQYQDIPEPMETDVLSNTSSPDTLFSRPFSNWQNVGHSGVAAYEDPATMFSHNTPPGSYASELRSYM